MDVRLPNLGESADSGSVVSLLVKEGDSVKAGQTILELENEKAVAPIPAPANGRVTKLRVKQGDKLSVGQVILTLAADGAGASEDSASSGAPGDAAQTDPTPESDQTNELRPSSETQAQEHSASAPEHAPDPAPNAKSEFPPPASPSLRKIARDLGIDLTRVRGSEKGGRIVLKDVRAYIAALQKPAQAPKPKPAVKAPSDKADFAKWGPITKKPLTPLRKTIGQRMQESWTVIPHVTQFDDADITGLLDLRKKWSAAYEQQGAKLTLTCFALKAVAATLKKHPLFNASLDESAQEIVFKAYYHIGLAVDTEAGLLVPVIRDVDKKNLITLAKELAELAAKAKDRKLTLDDMRGGSFTISNQGGIGGAHFTPIVNKPEVAILGLGRGALKPVVRPSGIEARTLLPVCLSYDHRVIDGGHAARFVQDLLNALENFPAEEAAL